MAQINADKLPARLKQGLAPVYLVTGDEPLLVQECCDAIRNIAREQGFTERELYHTDAGFKWEELQHSANALSLFAEKKLIEIRVHNGKPGDAGSKAIVEFCESAGEDTLLLLVLPKIDKRSRKSKWFTAVEKTGEAVNVWPVDTDRLPGWINQRMRAAGLSADSDAIDILAAKVEGNLLAAVQEIEKLRLLTTDNTIDSDLMTSVVMESARYNVFGLVDKALAGDSVAATRTLQGLRGEGTEAPVLLWALTREVRSLAGVKEAVDAGESFGLAAKRNGIWESRQGKIQPALQRLSLRKLQMLLRKCALADRAIKGMAAGDPWALLLDVTLGLAGVESFSAKTNRLMIR